MSKTYKNEAQAMRRVTHLINEVGCWPAIVSQADGRYHLSFDPDDEYDND